VPYGQTVALRVGDEKRLVRGSQFSTKLYFGDQGSGGAPVPDAKSKTVWTYLPPSDEMVRRRWHDCLSGGAWLLLIHD